MVLEWQEWHATSSLDWGEGWHAWSGKRCWNELSTGTGLVSDGGKDGMHRAERGVGMNGVLGWREGHGTARGHGGGWRQRLT